MPPPLIRASRRPDDSPPVRVSPRRSGLHVLFTALVAAGAIGGCATPGRLPAVPAAMATSADPGMGAVRYLVLRDISGFAEAARESVRREQAWRAAHGQTGPLPPMNVLAISAGGENGAFTAGLLNGWTARGDRPEFNAVTGVSTGALIAPLAFLGPHYDQVLTTTYTSVTQRDIFHRRSLLRGLVTDAFTDTGPLVRMTSRYVDRPLLKAIAAEYAKGRLLLVGTTNLDTGEPVIWNMTAIAASQDPHALELFRKVLLASAAIPGVFPPVMIDVTVDGVRYQEMHVDGAVSTQVFAYPPGLRLAEQVPGAGTERRLTLYVLQNSQMGPTWASVRRRALPIAAHAISTLMRAQGLGDLERIYVLAQRDHVDYRLAFIPKSFVAARKEPFDTAYMRSLYRTGYDFGAAGVSWRNTPPGYDSSLRTAAGAAATSMR